LPTTDQQDLGGAPHSLRPPPFRPREPDPVAEPLDQAPPDSGEPEDARDAEPAPGWPPADQATAPPALPGLDRVRSLFGRKRA
jgi:hypothetical protein